MSMKPWVLNLIIVLVFLLLIGIVIGIIIVVSRECSPREIDDIHQQIPCKQDLMDDATWLWVIPLYNNVPVSQDKAFCQKLLNSGKKLGMHGVKHTFAEFSKDITKEYLEEGMRVFEEAFGYKPTHFKPPKMMVTEHNMKLIKDSGMILHTRFQQFIHKVYHCEDHGRNNAGRLEHEIEV